MHLGTFENFTECWPSKSGYVNMVEDKSTTFKKKEQAELNPIYIKEHYANK